MKPNFRVVSCIAALAAASLLASSSVAFEKGDKVWSKHYETALLAEPKPLAATAATVGFAEKLKVKQVQGTWLEVKADKAEGWIFQGNVAAAKPEIAPAVGMKQIAAAETDTVAAARPLAPAAQDYAERNGAVESQAGIDWVDAQAALISRQQLLTFMTEHRLGEYQDGGSPEGGEQP